MYVAAPEPSQQCAGAVRYRSEVQIQFVTLAFSGTSCPAGSQLKCRFFVWRTIKFSAVDHVFCLCRVVLRPCPMFNRCGDARIALPFSLASRCSMFPQFAVNLRLGDRFSDVGKTVSQSHQNLVPHRIRSMFGKLVDNPCRRFRPDCGSGHGWTTIFSHFPCAPTGRHPVCAARG